METEVRVRKKAGARGTELSEDHLMEMDRDDVTSVTPWFIAANSIVVAISRLGLVISS